MRAKTAETDPAVPSARAPGPGDHVFLVDGSSFVFRAYFQSMNQDAKYNYRSDGLPTGALRLFCNKLYQFINDGAVGVKPTHLAIVFDKSEVTFRNEIYSEYKGTRREAPDDLVPQFPLMREAVEALGLHPVEQAGYEADDIIATYAREAESAGADVLIITADKDLMQLVTPQVQFYDFESGSKGRPGYRPERKIDIDGVIEYFGVPPEKVIDVQALVGDPSDNVPGIPGIGKKTASQLIGEYGDLETLLADAENIKQPKRRESLIQFADQARMSKRLVTLEKNVDVETPLAVAAIAEFDPRRFIAFLKAIELNAMVKRVADAYGIDPDSVEADPRLKAKGRGTAAHPGQVGSMATGYSSGPVNAPPPIHSGGDLFGRSDVVVEASGDEPVFIAIEAGAAEIANDVAAMPVDASRYTIIRDLPALDALIVDASATGRLAVFTVTDAAMPMAAELVGLAFSPKPGSAAYLPLGHRTKDDDLLGGGQVEGQIDERDALARLKPVLEDDAILKLGHDLKTATLQLARRGIALGPIDDVMLLAYALEGGRRDVSLGGLGERWLSHRPGGLKDLLGSGRNAVPADRLEIDAVGPVAAEHADVISRLGALLPPQLAAGRVMTVYETLERPMVTVLAAMERAGIFVDRQILSRLSHDFSQTMARLEDEIATIAGGPFNIASPKQLGEILFDKMAIPGGRKTKTGAWSTDADTLEELAAAGHELPARILEWRQVSKLKSTYTDALPGFINAETGRVHTSYALAATPTARLSSSDPNLQNIPIRTELGRKIRTAFVAEPGNKLISADYSQIELRVLAHIADIPQLRQAFADGLDIHAMTASEMFGVPVEGMPPDVRRRAKAINFGIIYGISAFGLANQLSIPRPEAKDYIERYFERFPGIRDYMEATKAFCRENGFVMTIFGRKCHYPLIQSRNPAERAFNERAAINATIQGSAADIIRRAMIRMPAALDHAGLNVRMLLQVHDELVFEAPEDEADRAIPIIAETMERAPEPAAKLSVPLQVDARAGDNWDAAH
jgi:DNA polymerase-1